MGIGHSNYSEFSREYVKNKLHKQSIVFVTNHKNSYTLHTFKYKLMSSSIVVLNRTKDTLNSIILIMYVLSASQVLHTPTRTCTHIHTRAHTYTHVHTQS